MSTTTTAAMPAVSLPEADTKVLREDAAAARKDARLDESTRPVWDDIVTRYGNGKGEAGLPKRADILRGVLVAAGEWKSTPQKGKDGKRTPFGNVVQRFGKRFDEAVKRSTPEADKPVTLRATLSGEGGGSTTIPTDHPLYADIVALIAESASE